MNKKRIILAVMLLIGLPSVLPLLWKAIILTPIAMALYFEYVDYSFQMMSENPANKKEGVADAFR